MCPAVVDRERDRRRHPHDVHGLRVAPGGGPVPDILSLCLCHMAVASPVDVSSLCSFVPHIDLCPYKLAWLGSAEAGLMGVGLIRLQLPRLHDPLQ